jgi:putative ATP-binding cassette transporter
MIGAARRFGSLLGDAARLAKPYFASQEKWNAWTLLGVVIGLSLVGVYLNVVFTFWYKVAYNALQSKNSAAFWSSMFTYRMVHGFPYVVPGFSEIAALAIIAAVYAFYLSQMLQIQWRQWLTTKFIRAWLDRRAYYQISLEARAGTPLDNPDQRIADDIRAFVTSNLTLGVGFLTNLATLFSFVGILYLIGPPLRVGGIVIHGYLVWAALVYSIAGTYFTQLIGRKLVPLTFQEQQVEADFRFNLVRIREHTEQIALYRGEDEEAKGLGERFHAIYLNWWKIMQRTKALNFFTIGFAQVAVVFPIVVAAPNYFSGIFTLGVLMQIASIFGNVQSALSWFVTSYPDLVAWRATIQRLDGFERAVHRAHVQSKSRELAMTAGGKTLRLKNLKVCLPDGTMFLEQGRFEVEGGEPLAIAGLSGVGKSTLLRVVAGIWPFVRGEITQPEGRLMFLPQRPYLPLGSLKHAAVYPMQEDDVADETVGAALTEVGLGIFASRLKEIDNWTLRLSGGEQQRLALARVLIVAPDWLFLDEAMSAIEEERIATLFAVLREHLPGTQIISVTHQKTVAALHPRRAEIAVGADGRRRITVLEPEAKKSSISAAT